MAVAKTPPATASNLAHRSFGLWFPIGVYLLFRGYAAVALGILSTRQTALFPGGNPVMVEPMPAHPGYWGVITNWDAQWYEYIATRGYATPVAGWTDPYLTGHSWAFPPAFPLVVKAVMMLGMSFPVAATVVNLVFGAVAMVLLFKLLEDRKGRFYAGAGVIVFNCFLSAPLLQMAYSEAMALMLLLLAFWLLSKRQYWWAIIPIVVLAFVRIVTPPFGLVVLVALIDRWRRRKEDRLGWGEGISLVVLGLMSVAGVFLWGRVSQFFSTASGTGNGPAAVPVGDAALHANDAASRVAQTHYFMWFTESYKVFGWWFPTLVAVLLAAAVVVAYLPMMKPWGREICTWFWAYPVFLAVATGNHAGILRYLLLGFPLLLPVIGIFGWGKRFVVVKVGILVVLGLVAQWLYMAIFLVVYPGSLMP